MGSLLREELCAQCVIERERPAIGLDARKAKSAAWREIAAPATMSEGSHGLSSALSLPTGPLCECRGQGSKCPAQQQAGVL